jgi:hypothetical protein
MSGDGDFLRRWSRRKVEARSGKQVEVQGEAASPAAPAPPAELPAQAPPPLPPVESLTYESDFTPFMKPEVDPGLRRQALKTLLRDPRFNVMDGLDVYIDDYAKPDPLPEEWLSQLNQMKRLGHYLEPEPDADAKPVSDEEATPKAMQEQPVAFPESAPAPDTASKESPPSESGNEPA